MSSILIENIRNKTNMVCLVHFTYVQVWLPVTEELHIK